MKFSKISLVLLSCFSLSKGAAIPNDTANLDLSKFFSNLIENNQTPAPAPAVQVAATANPTEINDDVVYTQDDLKKYTKFLINLVSGNEITPAQLAPVTTTTTTTTTAVATVAPTTPASSLLGDIKNLSAELDQIKERRVDEIGELIDIVKKVSQRLETLEETVEQTIAKQEASAQDTNTIPDTKEVDLNNAEVDNAQISPINETDLKYAAIFNAFNKQNEEKIAEMQQNEIKLLQEIKDLLANNQAAQAAPAPVNVDNAKAVVTVDNTAEVVNNTPPPETSQEAIVQQLNEDADEFEKLYQEINQNVEEYKKMVAESSEKVNSDEQFTKAAVIRDKTKTIKQYINKLASLAITEDQKKKLKDINEKYDNAEGKHIVKVNNDADVAKDEAVAKEIAKETAEEAKNDENIVSIDHVKDVLGDIAGNTVNAKQVKEVQRIIKEIQLNEQAEVVEEEAANLNEDQAVGSALNMVASNAVNEEQVEQVKDFIKSIEANEILQENLKKDEVLANLVYTIAANTTDPEQVAEVQRIIEKIELYNVFANNTQEQREENLEFAHRMADEIQKTPEEISQDLKNLLVNLVNNAKTEEEASVIAGIIAEIKKHDALIKEAQEQDMANYKLMENVESTMIENQDGTVNEVFFIKDNTEMFSNPEIKNSVDANIDQEVPEVNLDVEEPGSGNGIYIIGALGVIALAGFGYSYRSKAKKLNDEFPFSDNNLPFSNSMNGLVVDKNFLFRKNSISKPDHIINNDAVIRPSQPSWATSILMDENNKKGLKENIQITEDPEELLDEQLREIQNKTINKQSPSVVITIDDDDVTTKEPETPKPKAKTLKKPKLRRSISTISLDKKAKEDRENKETKEVVEEAPVEKVEKVEKVPVEKKSRKKSKKHQKKEKKSRKAKKVEEPIIDEETELSFNTSFILDAPSLLFDEDIEIEKTKKTLLTVEKPKVPKRISSCVTETTLPSLQELENEKSECSLTDEFAKELMDDYNKKFGEMEKDN